MGGELKGLFPRALTPSHRELDITDSEGAQRYVRENVVETVIHCAALTSVRHCEMNRAEAFATNVQGTRNLCEALLHNNKIGYFIYVSTACVFPGDDPEHYYSEDDIAYPKNFYGLTKLLGECVVSETARRYGGAPMIIRTNFVKRGKWKYRSAFVDRFGTYLYADQVAGEIKKIIGVNMRGLVHICGDTRMSMYELARIGDPEVKSMTLKNYEGPPVTVNMCLTSKKIPLIPFGVPHQA